MNPYETHTDEALAEIAGQSPDAFAILYSRYLPKVYGYVMKRVQNTAEAEDITSSIFMNVLDGLIERKYRAGSCFPAWLFSIARRRLVDFYNRRQSTPLEESLPCPAPDAATIAESNADLNQLSELLSRMDADKVDLLRLRYTANLSFAEIAALNGKKEPAAKMEIRRILEWLRNHWEKINV